MHLKNKNLILWSLLVFIVVTLLTMKLESHHDGIDKVGFPLTFYDNFSGKCEECYKDFGFHIWNLLFDVIVLFAITIVGLQILITKTKCLQSRKRKGEKNY